jgi:hypothetical protein
MNNVARFLPLCNPVAKYSKTGGKMAFDQKFFENHEKQEQARKRAGQLEGKHYTAYVAEVKELKKAGDIDAAAGLLLRLLDAVERESKVSGPDWPIPPWFHTQLAVIYRKQKAYAQESGLLRRFVLLHEGKRERPGEDVMKRLEKAQSLEVAAGTESST